MKDFTQGSITKQIIIFVIPMMIGSAFQQFYSLADAVIVGRYIGGGSLAAVGISITVSFFLTSLLIGLTSGASILISQLYGAKDTNQMKRVISTSIIFLTIFAIILTVVGITLAPLILRALGAPVDIVEDARIYMQITMGGIIFTVFYNMYTAYLRALGETKRPLYILIFSSLLNIGLNYLFVPILNFGIVGAATGTVISQGVAAILCYIYVRRKVPLLRIPKLVFDRVLLMAILKYGLPAALQMSMVALAALIITRLINSFGTAAIASIVAVQRIDQLAIIPIFTLSMGLSIFVGQNMGAGKEERCLKGLRIVMIQALVVAIAISGGLLIFGRRLIALFIYQYDENIYEILEIGHNYMRIMILFYFLFAILFSFNGFFKGVGDAMIAMIFPAISLTIRTVSAYALVYLGGMGPEALAWSIPLGWSVACILSFIYYKRRLWVGKMAIKKADSNS
jgi:putative MATE family efflux protein